MLHQIISRKKNAWLHSPNCTVKDLLAYMKQKAALRQPQIEAIETYLFLKIQGRNTALWQLFAEGFFIDEENGSTVLPDKKIEKYFAQNKSAFALYNFAVQKNEDGLLLPGLANGIMMQYESMDYESIIKSLFYNVSYTDYLMSLPMGAGKTFLMAAIIYLDIYFAEMEPDNNIFSKNFLVLVPSGLKSSVTPGLKTMRAFDVSWILPEPFATRVKTLVQFHVLDDVKPALRSNTVQNPNAQKVNACLPNPYAQVFLVNAEKVILQNFKFDDRDKMIDEEEDKSNDLKKLFAKIPALGIFVDEVHHAAANEIKLRQAIAYWHKKGDVKTVTGFTGTPYLPADEKITAGNFLLKTTQISNTVYYFPLMAAVASFLKKPVVKIAAKQHRLEIIKNGIADFNRLYKTKVYADGSIAKVAVYCATIQVLEEEVFPFLTGQLKINADEILKYHGGNKQYTLPKANELDFRSLDFSFSAKRYILLVQIGKEGWDCKSLTAVILSQKGDSPANMVLQTACRCLRQCDADAQETALIWLNSDNAATLNKQLQQTQHSSIKQLNDAAQVFPDSKKSKVPQWNDEEEMHMSTNIFVSRPEKSVEFISEKLEAISRFAKEFQRENIVAAMPANYNDWLFTLYKTGFGLILLPQLRKHHAVLQNIFNNITREQNGYCFFNDACDVEVINSAIRRAF